MTAFDAVGPAGGAGTAWTTSPGTWTHVNNGNAIIVAVTIFTGSANTVTSVTYGGVTLNLLKFQVTNSGGGGIVFYGLSGPTVPVGSNTVSVATSEANNHNGGSVSLTAAGSLGTPVGASTTGATSSSVSVPGTTTGGMIVTAACFGGDSGGTFSGSNSVTIRWQKESSNSSGADNGVEGTVPSTGGGASQTVGFTQTATGDDWGIIAVEVLPGGGGGIPQMREQRRGKRAGRRAGAQRQQQMASFASAGQPATAVPPGLLQFPVTVPDSVSW